MTAPTNANPPITTQTGLVLLRGGRVAEAETVFRHLIAQNPANLQAYNGLAFTLKITNRLEEARHLLGDVCNRYPGEKSLWGTFGTVLMDLGGYEPAIQALKKSIALDPCLVAGLNNLALAYSKAENRKVAVDQWQLAIKIHPTLLEAYLNLLSNLIQGGDHKKAAVIARAAIAHLPKSAEIRLLAAQSCAATGDEGHAMQLLWQSAVLTPAAKDVWFELSNLNSGISRYPAYSIACAPDDAKAHFNLGSSLAVQKQWDGSNAAYKRALEIDPKLAEAKLGLASNHLSERRFNGAISLLTGYLSAKPDDPRAQFMLASCLRNTGRPGEAKPLFAQILDRRPQHFKALLELSYIASTEGDAENALRLALDACMIAPQSADAHVNLGHLYREAKQYELALKHYENSLVLSPNSAEALCYKYHLIQELGLLGQPYDAPELWLKDMTQTVGTKRLTRPSGFNSLGAFNGAVIEYAKTHPSLKWEPEGKTTRHGRQTTPTLLAGQTGPVASALREAIYHRLEEYLGELSLAECDFLSAIRPDELRINLWCVFLEPGGHQLTHNHPAGWISGVYYLKIPPSVVDSDGNDGSIEFGMPHKSFEHAERHPTVTVKPEEGLMAMFPSALFHRTFPYEEGQRICVAFDIVSKELEFRD